MAVDLALAESLIGQLTKDLQPDGRLGLVRRYLAGEHDLPYMPNGAKPEFKRLAENSVDNWLPLVSDTFVKGLFVDGYRAPKAGSNAKAWAWWQANGLDARQGIAHRGAIDYGTAYVLVLPGKDSTPVIKPLSPLRSLAWYADDDDEFPELALYRVGRTARGDELWDIFDERTVYHYAQAPGERLRAIGAELHGMKVTPFVRFRDRLDGESVGIIRPLIPAQNRINDIVFSTQIALQYASFRQRWATGLAIPEDEDGNPIEPLQSAIDRLWVSDDSETRFGDFSQTEVSGHLLAYGNGVKTLAARGQISPNVLTGDLVNLSADALAQMERSTQSKLGEYETLFGESWEDVFRLAAVAAGDADAARDTASQVRWRDTEARSLAATVDALGKLAQMLQVPVEALWERIPGVTDTDVAYWRSLREDGDVLGRIVGDFTRQAAAITATPAPAADASTQTLAGAAAATASPPAA